MRESYIERHLVRAVEALGGMAPKFKSPQRNNVPDRIVLLPGGRVYFVELKATDVAPNDAQLREHKRLRDRGFTVLVIDSKAGADEFIKGLEG